MTETSATRLKTPEMAGITFKIAESTDSTSLSEFLSRGDIDSLFTPKLSDPIRGITIEERIDKKFKSGSWMLALKDGKVVGCMAVVNTSVSKEVPPLTAERKISEGISLADWDVEKIMELSTVVTDPKLKLEGVKGVGAGILSEVKKWVAEEGKGKWGLVTDSWIGGDMGGFVTAMNRKSLPSDFNSEDVDTIIRIYSDPDKRGVDGPPTVLYGIPLTHTDWEFFKDKKDEIGKIRSVYDSLSEEFSNKSK